MRKWSNGIVGFVVFGLGLPGVLLADDDSLWDLGVGLTSVSIPDYNGAEHTTRYTLPFPYFVYRGQYLKVVDGRFRFRLFSTERVFLGLSTDGTPPVQSDENPVRSGMPDLDALGEIGPTLEVDIFGSATDSERLYLDLPVRAAISTDLSSVEHIGWIANPRLAYNRRFDHWRFGTSVSVAFADEPYYDFYYGVSPQFVTASRSMYRAPSGFGGVRLSGSLTMQQGQFWASGFARYTDLSGAVFRDSPLVAQSHNLLLGISVAWIIRSAARPAKNFEGCKIGCDE